MVVSLILVHYNIHPQGVIGVGSIIHTIEGHCGCGCDSSTL